MENGKQQKPQKPRKKRAGAGPAAVSLEEKLGLRARLGAAWARFLSARILSAAVLLYILVSVALLYPSLTVPLQPGMRAPHDIVSPRRMEYVDDEATESARTRARDNIEKVYLVDIDNLLADTRDLTGLVSGIFSDVPVDEFQDVSSVRDHLLDNMYLKQETVEALIEKGRNGELQTLQGEMVRVLDELTDGRASVEQDHLDNIETRVQEMAPSKGIPASDVPVIADILKSLVAKNRSYAAEETDRLRDAAATAVKPITRTTEQKKPIIKKGETVTAAHVRAFRNANLEPMRVPWGHLGGSAIMLAILFVIGGVYLRNALPRVYANYKKMFMLFMLIFMSVLWALMVHTLHMTIPQFSPFALGVASSVFAILACFLVKPQAALAVSPLLAAGVTICLGLGPGVLFIMLATGLAGYFFAMQRQDMDSIMKAGVAVAAISIVSIAALHLINFESLTRALMDTLLFGAANGLLTAVLATGLLPLFERVFNVITPHRLLELSNPEHPLLKKLLINAPGTYHHCIFVGNLAETAAEAVGADPLLVRIACYYHDVGKLIRPYFFAENQLHGENPLDDKSPSMGALIIYQHVKEGIELLRDHKLPTPIIRIASEHHGTCLISFFYQQARSQAKDPDTVSEERFRYPGPTPSTLESAIVMLSDGCEAAVRSLKEYSTRNIENTVNAIVKARLVDGQFDHCDITLQQIDTVRKTLIETLSRIYHARVEYPDEEELKKKFQSDHVPNGRQSGKAS